MTISSAIVAALASAAGAQAPSNPRKVEANTPSETDPSKDMVAYIKAREAVQREIEQAANADAFSWPFNYVPGLSDVVAPPSPDYGAMAAMRIGANGSPPFHRLEALEALGRLGLQMSRPKWQQAEAMLRDCAEHDPSSFVRLKALASLLGMGIDKPSEPAGQPFSALLVGIIRDLEGDSAEERDAHEQWTRQAIQLLAGVQGNAESSAALADVLTHRPSLALDAAVALGDHAQREKGTGGPAGEEGGSAMGKLRSAYASHAHESQAQIRAAAVAGLARALPASADIMAQALRDNDDTVRLRTAIGLHRAGLQRKEAWDVINGIIGNLDHPLWGDARQYVMEEGRSEERHTELLRQFGESNRHARRVILEALEPQVNAHVAVRRLLENALEDEGKGVRAVAEAILQRHPASKTTEPTPLPPGKGLPY